jgi:hypothetical protein
MGEVKGKREKGKGRRDKEIRDKGPKRLFDPRGGGEPAVVAVDSLCLEPIDAVVESFLHPRRHHHAELVVLLKLHENRHAQRVEGILQFGLQNADVRGIDPDAARRLYVSPLG